MDVDTNLWAVLTAAVINMLVGALWYSPVLFGETWQKLIGKKPSELQSNALQGYLVAMVAALVQVVILAHFVRMAGAVSPFTGATVGFQLWLGFTAVTSALNTAFAGRSWRLWALDAGYFLVVLVINGALLAYWT